MDSLEDTIDVFEFKNQIRVRLFENHIYLVSDVILLTNKFIKDMLDFGPALYLEFVDKVHEKGYGFIDEFSIEKQREIRNTINMLKGQKEIRYINDVNICDMNLSTRSINALKRAGINNLSTLANLDCIELERIRSLGEVHFLEIVDKIHSCGVLLRNESPKNSNYLVKVINDNSYLEEQINELHLKNEKLKNVIERKKGLLKEYELLKESNNNLCDMNDYMNREILNVLLENMYVTVDDVDDIKRKIIK